MKQNAAIYADDIVIGSKDFNQHLEHLQELFRDVRQAGIKLNLSKTKLARSELEFVGHVISMDGVKPIESRVQIIQEIESPKTVRQLSMFIGFVSYYRKFVDHFSNLLIPLNDLLKINRKWEWRDVHQKAFEEIKKSFLRCITLKYPDVNEPYILSCDASGLAVAAILSQKDYQGEEQIIEITSRCLNSAEKKYSTTEKELLSILNAVQKWRHYLLGNRVIVRTDHQALMFLNKG